MTKTHDERLAQFNAAGLYLVSSASASAGRSTLDILQAALDAGVSLIQLREKELSPRDYFVLAEKARNLTHRYGALLILNDRLDAALAIEADGVHLGQDDFPLRPARKIAPHLLIGASTHSIAEALQAQADGASYVNVGPLFPTQTKIWSGEFLGWKGLESIIPTLQVPFSVMGGIKPEHIPGLRQRGVRVIALVSAVTAAPDPTSAALDLLRLIHATG
jgi:thiamine-phosphate pyrophosphorylase